MKSKNGECHHYTKERIYSYQPKGLRELSWSSQQNSIDNNDGMNSNGHMIYFTKKLPFGAISLYAQVSQLEKQSSKFIYLIIHADLLSRDHENRDPEKLHSS